MREREIERERVTEKGAGLIIIGFVRRVETFRLVRLPLRIEID